MVTSVVVTSSVVTCEFTLNGLVGGQHGEKEKADTSVEGEAHPNDLRKPRSTIDLRHLHDSQDQALPTRSRLQILPITPTRLCYLGQLYESTRTAKGTVALICVTLISAT